MSSTATNKQPLLVDRPLYGHALITNQTVGNESTVNVQGGQAPQLLVDMDAALAIDTNNGGLVESIFITRNENYCPPSYTVNAATSGTRISLTSGMVVYLWEDPDVITATGPSNGAGYYTYTGAASVFASGNTQIQYSGGLQDGFTYAGEDPYLLDQVQFAFYHTRGTTTPIPGNNNYHTIFVATVGVGASQTDCTRFMPHLQTPVPQQGQTAGMDIADLSRTEASTSKEATDSSGVANGVSTSGTTDVNDAFYVTAQGGFY